MRLAFDAFELDVWARELRRNAEPVALEPKVFDLLVYLISKRDRVVSKEELNEAIWQRRIVSDAALDTCIKAARRAIADDGKSQRVIRTVPRKGYRFIATVTERTPPIDHGTASMKVVEPVLSKPLDAIEAEIAALRLPDQPSIAVLPFENLTPDDRRFALSDGLFCDITTRLGRTRWLFVIARASSSQFTASQVLEAGSRLAVRYVVQGSVQSRGGRVRVNVALTDTVERAEVWAEIFDRTLDEVFAIQDEIADAVVTRVQSELEAIERRRALLRPLASLTAWSAYHRACWHLDRHTPDDYDRAEQFFHQAARLDPGAARVFAGLSYVHRQRAFLELTRDRQGAVQRTDEFARQSLALDPNDAMAHWVMGRALLLQNEVKSALAEFEVAALLNPSFAMGHYSVGHSSAMLGETAVSDRAVQVACRLSPIDPIRFSMLGTQTVNAAHDGNYVRAAALAELAANQPNVHHHIIAIAAMCNTLVGNAGSSERYLRKLHSMRPNYTRGQFFRAFAFQRPEHRALWDKCLGLLGIAE